MMIYKAERLAALVNRHVAQIARPDIFGARADQPIAEALAQFGRAVLPRLIEALRSPNWKTRSGAIDALRMMGDPEAIPALEQVVSNAEDRTLLIRATEAIDRIRKQAK